MLWLCAFAQKDRCRIGEPAVRESLESVCSSQPFDSQMQLSRSPLLLRFNRQRFYFDIPLGRTLIGRLPRCQLVIGAGGVGVSREHAEIVRMNDRLFIKDLNSRNGTLVNGRDIRGQGEVELKLGDSVEICEYQGQITDVRRPFDDSGVCRVDAQDESEQSSSNLVYSHFPPQGTPHARTSFSDTRLAALISIGKSIGDALHTERVLETAVASVLEIFPGADRCVIGFRAPTDTFEAKWWTVREGTQASEIRISQRIFGHVLKTADSVLFDDAVTHFASANADANGDSVLAGALRSVMCAPLTEPDGNVFGMIQSDSRTSHRFSQQDLDIFATVATQISLALNFSRLHLQTIEDAVIRKDIEQANAVQRQFLPSASPLITDYQFSDYYSAARHVGGDYFDYINLPDGRIAIVLGDVVGKGVPAALTMVQLATEMRTAFEVVDSAAEAMTRLNRRLTDSFVTGVIMLLDTNNNQLSIANAGHDSPLIKSANGQLHRFGEHIAGFPISVVEGWEYEESHYSLQPGDMVVVFSDGFIDAENLSQTDRFGIKRIERIVQKHQGSAHSLKQAIIDEIDSFTSGAAQFDDMCLVCFQRQA